MNTQVKKEPGQLERYSGFSFYQQACSAIAGDATLPLRWLRQLPLCGLAAREHLALQAVPVQQVYNLSIPKQDCP